MVRDSKAFLQWIHDRLVHVHGENPLFDYMHRLRSIVAAEPACVIRVNWYKASGKWYAQDDIVIPDTFQEKYPEGKDSLQLFIEANQKQLAPSWLLGSFYMSVSCLHQTDTDTRFFERLYKYGDVK